MSTFIYIDDLRKGNDKPLFLDEKQGFVISDPGATRTRDQWLKSTLRWLRNCKYSSTYRVTKNRYATCKQ